MSYIRALDQEIRVVIKEVLHLPQCTANGLIYCSKRDGRLGFPKLEILQVSATMTAGLKFLAADDPVVQALARGETGLESRLSKLSRSARLQWPTTAPLIRQWKVRAKKRDLQDWAQLRAQGKSVESLTDDKIGNAWLFKPTLLKPCRYITALKMRTDTCANKVALNRAQPQDDLSCRQCRTQLETLGHVLGQCTSTKGQRIRRHNEIRDLIVDVLAKKGPEVVVTKEPSLRHPLRGNLKPDLVAQIQGRCST